MIKQNNLKGTSKNLFHESTKYDFYNFFEKLFDAHLAQYFVKSPIHCVGYATEISLVFNKKNYRDS